MFVNDELSINDLIIKYMLVKLENGYEPSFTMSEFEGLIKYYSEKNKLKYNYNINTLYDNFLDNKKDLWSYVDEKSNRLVFNPHLDLVCSNGENIIKANDYLKPSDSIYVSSIKSIASRNDIIDYLEENNIPKRDLDKNIDLTPAALEVGKSIANQMLEEVLTKYASELLNMDANKRVKISELFYNMSIENITKLKEFKEKITNCYDTISKRIAVLYMEDSNAIISNDRARSLAYSNYEAIIKDYKKMFISKFDKYNCYFKIFAIKLFKSETVSTKVLKK